ncbi:MULTISPECIES: phage tail assembly protein [unclassified Mesorhizobium]|uniref:phage tail assembly protein n=1 Tax=unclassified Mesorhizobium TaxID=325217 RepID=UPI0033386B08
MPPKNAIEDFMTGGDDAQPVDDAAGAIDEAAVEASEDETVVTEFDDADCRVHRLRTTLTRNGERVTVIKMRPPTLRDIDDWSAAGISNRDLLVRLSGCSAATLKALAWEDAEKVMAIFQGLVPDFIFNTPKGDV